MVSETKACPAFLCVDADAAVGTYEVYNESCQGLVIPSALLLVVGVLHAAFAKWQWLRPCFV